LDNNPAWGPTHALVPNPTVLNDHEVRIHCSFLDADFKGQIGYVDLKISDQIEVIGISKSPILELGNQGSFSQFGTGMGTFWPKCQGGDLIYVGFDRPSGFKFKAFSGIATNEIDSDVYRNIEMVPTFGAEMGGSTIVGVHDVVELNNDLNVFVSIGNGFQNIEGRDFPKYQVSLFRGKDLRDLKLVRHNIIPTQGNTYRIGRPQVYEIENGFEMLVTAGTLEGQYLPRVFYSGDLETWTEESTDSFTKNSLPGVDDSHQCYLSRFRLGEREFIVYNGNNMGLNGFALAEGFRN
jgi:hypothetical protein